VSDLRAKYASAQARSNQQLLQQRITAHRVQCLRPVFVAWREQARRRAAAQKALLTRMLLRWSRSQLWSGWRQWRHGVVASTVQQIQRVWAQGADDSASAGYLLLQPVLSDAPEVLSALVRSRSVGAVVSVVRRCRQRTAGRVWRVWSQAVQSAVRRRLALRRVVGAARRRALHSGWRVWNRFIAQSSLAQATRASHTSHALHARTRQALTQWVMGRGGSGGGGGSGSSVAPPTISLATVFGAWRKWARSHATQKHTRLGRAMARIARRARARVWNRWMRFVWHSRAHDHTTAHAQHMQAAAQREAQLTAQAQAQAEAQAQAQAQAQALAQAQAQALAQLQAQHATQQQLKQQEHEAALHARGVKLETAWTQHIDAKRRRQLFTVCFTLCL
jgi:hypothetical protein